MMLALNMLWQLVFCQRGGGFYGRRRHISISQQRSSLINLPEFSKFVNHVLSQRNNELPVFSVELVFCGMDSGEFVKSIIDYGFSHNIQQLIVTLLLNDRLASTWELPALTTLHLYNVALFGHDTGHETSLLSKCVNLKNLTLRDCHVGGRGLRIRHSQLSDPTLINLGCKQDCLDVVAPQLKNLTLKNYYVNPRIDLCPWPCFIEHTSRS
nr:hypothetical protein [Tanacetum cinerariifolium]